MSKKIFVFDDEERFSSNWIKDLSSIDYVDESFELEKMNDETFMKLIRRLIEKQNSIRNKDKIENDIEIFDNDSIFFIDFDLINQEKGYYFTGETVAYLVRCFTQCGLIVGLNQYGSNSFDLTLKGHPESFCDLNIGTEQLTNGGLWTKDFPRFRPWFWPLLPDLLDKRKQCYNEIIDNLEIKLCDLFGFEEQIKLFPKSVNDFLGEKPEEVTPIKFVFGSEFALRKKDRIQVYLPKENVANIASARISKWIERLVMPGQNILVDACHLISRYPSLFTGNKDDISELNKLCSLNHPDVLPLIKNEIEKNRFMKAHWATRPLWYWKKIAIDEEILEIRRPSEKKTLKFKFCEDASRFVESEKVQPFSIDSDSPYLTRFIEKNPSDPSVEYRPKNRILM